MKQKVSLIAEVIQNKRISSPSIIRASLRPILPQISRNTLRAIFIAFFLFSFVLTEQTYQTTLPQLCYRAAIITEVNTTAHEQTIICTPQWRPAKQDICRSRPIKRKQKCTKIRRFPVKRVRLKMFYYNLRNSINYYTVHFGI